LAESIYESIDPHCCPRCDSCPSELSLEIWVRKERREERRRCDRECESAWWCSKVFEVKVERVEEDRRQMRRLVRLHEKRRKGRGKIGICVPESTCPLQAFWST
jgi:hypothetical protein